MSGFSPEAIRARAAARTAAREIPAQENMTSNIFTEGNTTESNAAEEVLVENTKTSPLVEVVEESATAQEDTVIEETNVEEDEEVRNQASQLLEAMKESSKDVKCAGEQGSGLAYSITEPKQEEDTAQSVDGEVKVKLDSKPSLADTSVFQNLTATSASTGIDGGDSYAELVENLISSQCQMSGVKNLDLTTFGLRAQVLKFPNLTVMEYGVHKFLGAPFTEDEENMIIHRLGLHVAQSNKDKIVVSAVQEVKDTRGMSFYSLLFNDRIAQRFADMFNYTVHANMKESDVSKLVLVIQK